MLRDLSHAEKYTEPQCELTHAGFLSDFLYEQALKFQYLANYSSAATIIVPSSYY